ncbi:MAG: hypothetical protein KME09_01240 [Pleurocapsa minor HA4230-MV1]|jgi:hypothetical protein|nr:hypothetical protein [Pleurocapsa minor HA4230-MV1]
MTLNIALQQEQQQRVKNDLILAKRQIHEEAGLNTDLYSAGYFEGYIGCEPSHPEQHSYWAGYQVGCREYWAKKLGVEIPSEF